MQPGPTEKRTSKPDPIAAGFEAGVYYYLRDTNGPVELAFDFTQGDNATIGKFNTMATALEQKFGKPVQKSREELSLAFNGHVAPAMLEWLEAHYPEKESTHPQEKYALRETLSEQSPPQAAGDISLAEFLKRLNTVSANSPSLSLFGDDPEQMREGVKLLRDAMEKLTTTRSWFGKTKADETFDTGIRERLAACKKNERQAVCHTLMGEWLEMGAALSEKVSISPIARGEGFIVNMPKPVEISQKDWKDHLTTTAQAVRLLLDGKLRGTIIVDKNSLVVPVHDAALAAAIQQIAPAGKGSGIA